MHLTRRLVDYTSLAVVLCTTIAGALLYPQLPEQVAIHFSASGTPDNYVTRDIGITLLPAIMLLTLLFLRSMPRLDPTANRHVLHVTTIGTMLLFATVQGIVLAYNVGYDVPFDLLLAGIIAWVVVIAGYAFYQEQM